MEELLVQLDQNSTKVIEYKQYQKDARRKTYPQQPRKKTHRISIGQEICDRDLEMIFYQIEAFFGLENLNNVPRISEFISNSECDEEPQPPGYDQFQGCELKKRLNQQTSKILLIKGGIQVKLQERICKIFSRDNLVGLNLKDHLPRTLMQVIRSFIELQYKKDKFKQQPLDIPSRQEEDDPIVNNFRKLKQKEEQFLLEQLRKKQSFLRKISDSDNKENKQKKDIENKQYTFKQNGDIIFIHKVNTENLPNTLKLPECKITDPQSQKYTKRESLLSRTSNFKQFPKKTKNTTSNSLNIQDPRMKRVPKIHNIIDPMGSNFGLIQPSQGTIIHEQGQSKVGTAYEGKRELGQITLDEYKTNYSKFLKEESTSKEQVFTPQPQNQFLTLNQDQKLIRNKSQQISITRIEQPSIINQQSYFQNPSMTMQSGFLFGKRNGSIDKIQEYRKNGADILLTDESNKFNRDEQTSTMMPAISTQNLAKTQFPFLQKLQLKNIQSRELFSSGFSSNKQSSRILPTQKLYENSLNINENFDSINKDILLDKTWGLFYQENKKAEKKRVIINPLKQMKNILMKSKKNIRSMQSTPLPSSRSISTRLPSDFFLFNRSSKQQ